MRQVEVAGVSGRVISRYIASEVNGVVPRVAGRNGTIVGDPVVVHLGNRGQHIRTERHRDTISRQADESCGAATIVQDGERSSARAKSNRSQCDADGARRSSSESR